MGYSVFGKSTPQWGWQDGTTGKGLALFTDDSGSIPSSHMISLSMARSGPTLYLHCNQKLLNKKNLLPGDGMKIWGEGTGIRDKGGQEVVSQHALLLVII